jgi:hypothetical protein
MDTTQDRPLAGAQDDALESPMLVEQLGIDELATREEFSACCTIIEK